MIRAWLQLLLHGRRVQSAFGLLPRTENGLTFALGYALQHSPKCLRTFWDKLSLPRPTRGVDVTIALQVRHDLGITDIEFRARGRLLAVIEAKIGGWPGKEQLSRYADRLRREGTPRSVLVPLGVQPFSPLLWNLPNLHGIPVVPLRWVDVLTLVTTAARGGSPDERQILGELSAFIQEVIGMQSYNREVLVRDVNCRHASYPLFMEHNMYACQPDELAEPLFFAPCFTSAPTTLGNGIHYVSRVYFRAVVSLKDPDGVQRALDEAVEVVRNKAEPLRSRKGAVEQVHYLDSLPPRWSRGWRYLRKRGWRETGVLFFLGNAIRLPVPLKKRGSMIPKGFSMTMEQLMSAGPGVFRC